MDQSMGLIRQVMAIVFLTAACCPVPLRPQNLVRITGTLVDQTGALIPKAEVILKQAGQQTGKTSANAFGSFTFSVQPGVYSLDVSSPGFETLTIRNITISGSEVKVLPPISLQVAAIGRCDDDDLQPPTFAFEAIDSNRGEVTGEVVNNNGAFMRGVSVTISPSAGRLPSSRTATDEWGKFTVTALRPGTYSLTASLPGHADFAVRAIVVTGGHRTRISPALQIDECPRGVACKPAYKLRVPVLCL
jgi:hypothetical protein